MFPNPWAFIDLWQKILLCHASLNQLSTSFHPVSKVDDWFPNNALLGHRSSVVHWSLAGGNIAPVVQLMHPGSGTLSAFSKKLFVNITSHNGACRQSTQRGLVHFYGIDDPSSVKKKVNVVDLHPHAEWQNQLPGLGHSQDCTNLEVMSHVQQPNLFRIFWPDIKTKSLLTFLIICISHSLVSSIHFISQHEGLNAVSKPSPHCSAGAILNHLFTY